MYPLIGYNIFIDYEDVKYEVEYINDHVLKFKGPTTNEIVEYVTVLVDKNIYLLYWYEPMSKNLVSQVQNLKTMTVYSNVVNLVTTNFYHYKGKITPFKNQKDRNEKIVESTTPTQTNQSSSTIKDIKANVNDLKEIKNTVKELLK